MPNELGLLTKQEAKAVRDLNLQSAGDLIKEITELIKSVQYMSYTQTEIIFNRVLTTSQYLEVEKYFKNGMSYNVIPSTTGLPIGQTRLVSISWL